MDLTTIIAQLKRRYTRETLPTSQWEELIARAVRHYSRYNPYETTTTTTTVADQAEYDMPADCLYIRDVQWLWDTTLRVWDITTDYDGEPIKATMPSLEIIDDINEADYVRRTTGRWRQYRGSQKIVLDPTPTTSGDTVTIFYGAYHVLNDDGYDTIPDEDLDIVCDLTLYELYGDRGAELALEPNYSTGMEREDFSHIQEGLARVREELLRRAEGRYGGTGGVLW